IRGEGVADGAAALRALRERTFDVIISDVRMPGMSGREFLDQLRRERPNALPRLVFSTGDTFAPDTAALLRDSGVPTVTKPFDFAELERVIREVAARTAAEGTTQTMRDATPLARRSRTSPRATGERPGHRRRSRPHRP